MAHRQRRFLPWGRIGWLVFIIAILLVTVIRLTDDESGSSTRLNGGELIHVSEETTRIVEPCDEHGRIDYVEALNRQAGAGVSPEQNFEVVVRQVMGVQGIDSSIRDEYFRRLGIPSLPENPRSFESVDGFLKRRFFENDDGSQNSDIQAELKSRGIDLVRFVSHAWTVEEFPLIGEWLVANKEFLDAIVDGSCRPSNYTPCIASQPDTQTSVRVLSMSIGFDDERSSLSFALAVYAMERTGNGDAEHAWEVLQSIHRLARHTVSPGASTFQASIVARIERRACMGEIGLLEYGILSPEQLRTYESQLRRLPLFPSLRSTIDQHERFVFLDTISALSHRAAKGQPLGTESSWQKLSRVSAADEIDWNSILRWGNRQYDELSDIYMISDSVARRRAGEEFFDAVDRRLKEQSNQNVLTRWFSGPRSTQIVGDVVFAHLAPCVDVPAITEQQLKTHLTQTRLAYLITAYCIEQKTLPDRLDDLVPRYLEAIPREPFIDAPMLYHQHDDGFSLSSVGPMQTDKRSLTVGDETSLHSDHGTIRVRVPAMKTP